MADRPILFSAPMVRANQNDIKTNTRRIFKHIEQTPNGTWHIFNSGGGVWGVQEADVPTAALDVVSIAVGDRLWVKETWRTESRAYDDLAPSEMSGEETVLYDADADWKLNKSVGKTRVSIHMPRWASRLTLIIEGVKVERLQDISEEDAVAEGWPAPEDRAKSGIAEIKDAYPIGWYAWLWDQINGRGAWDSNPWVIAYAYRVVKQNIDQIGGNP